MVRITLHFPTYLETLDQDIIQLLTILSFQEFYISLDQQLFFYFKYFLKTPIKNNTA